jgi:hypothetical protein
LGVFPTPPHTLHPAPFRAKLGESKSRFKVNRDFDLY